MIQKELKILLVDDEEMVRGLFREYFITKGYQLITASGGEEALSLLENDQTINFLIVDMQMPVISGFQLIQEIRKKKFDLPIIVISGYLGDDSRMPEKLTEMGVDNVFSKPVDFLRLVETMESIWQDRVAQKLREGEAQKGRDILEKTNKIMREIVAHQKEEIENLKKERMELLMDRRVLWSILQNTEIGIAVSAQNCLHFRCCSKSFQEMLQINPKSGMIDVLAHSDVVVSGFSDVYFQGMATGKKLDFNIKTGGRTIQLIANPVTNGDSEGGEVLLIALDVSDRVYLQELERQKSFDREQLLIELVEKGKRAAFVDSLTGVDNRHSFDINFKTFLESKQAFLAIIFDIDHFKAVNDNYGHVIGDEALKAVAERLRNSFNGFLARYGGEEFIALLPGCGDFSVAERIRAQASGKYSLGRECEAISITVSAGAGVFQPGDDPKEFIKEIDRKLYIAKEEGRNKLVFN